MGTPIAQSFPRRKVSVGTKSAHNPMVRAIVVEDHAPAEYRCSRRIEFRATFSQERTVLRHYVDQPVDEEYGNAHAPQVCAQKAKGIMPM